MRLNTKLRGAWVNQRKLKKKATAQSQDSNKKIIHLIFTIGKKPSKLGMVLTDLNRSSFDPAALKLRMCIEPESACT